jgi:hypothetical protein
VSGIELRATLEVALAGGFCGAGVAGIQLSALVGSAAGASVALVLCAAAALGAMPWRRAGRAPRRPAAAPGRAR